VRYWNERSRASAVTAGKGVRCDGLVWCEARAGARGIITLVALFAFRVGKEKRLFAVCVSHLRKFFRYQ